MSVWSDTPELVEQLRDLHAAGLPYADIGARLGVSLGAVAGKVKRLGLIPEKKRRPISIPLREVIRLAGQFSVRRNVEAITIAMRREEPGHPGFVLQVQMIRWP